MKRAPIFAIALQGRSIKSSRAVSWRDCMTTEPLTTGDEIGEVFNMSRSRSFYQLIETGPVPQAVRTMLLVRRTYAPDPVNHYETDPTSA